MTLTRGSGVSFLYKVAQELSCRIAEMEPKKWQDAFRAGVSPERHLAACLAWLLFTVQASSGYIWASPVRGPVVCCNWATIFFASISTIAEASFRVLPYPKWSPGRQNPVGTLSAYMAVNSRCTSGINQVSHTVPTEGFLCKIFVEAQVVEKLPSKLNSINNKINNDIFSIWVLIAQNSKIPRKSS